MTLYQIIHQIVRIAHEPFEPRPLPTFRYVCLRNNTYEYELKTYKFILKVVKNEGSSEMKNKK